jgi:hypothetical protein
MVEGHTGDCPSGEDAWWEKCTKRTFLSSLVGKGKGTVMSAGRGKPKLER